MNALARATLLLDNGQCAEALKIARDGIGSIGSLDEPLTTPRELTGALRQSLEESLAIRPVLRPREASAFIRQGDYWTIRYQGEVAILKATRGLACLGYLLRHPRREIHVSELLATLIEVPAPASLSSLGANDGVTVTAALSDLGPILDSQAKSEYKRRIGDLRKDMEEAERFNDSHRATSARSEMDAIARYLTSAIALGGRDRKTSSEAERTRCAATKRIKQAIQKIADSIPALGHHLTARIKTGYFCSYNPHPDRPVAWKF